MTHQLPPGWLETTIDELFRTTGGGTPATGRSEFWGNGVPWITSADIDDVGDISPRKAVTQSAIASSATNAVPPGSVVVATRVGLGKVALATKELCFSQDCQALLFNPQLLAPLFVAHQIRRTVRGIRGRGTTISGVTVKQLGALPFRLAPLAEQHRIVEAIDSYLTRLDEAVANLQRVQTKLKAYRASVLRAAVEGRLVPSEASLARAEMRVYEPAEELLARILKEHRRRWEEAQLAKFKVAGKAPRDEKWKAKYQEPLAPDTRALPRLPQGWCWATWERVADRVTVGHVGRMKNEYCDKGVPFLRGQNVKANQFDPRGLKYVSENFHRRLGKSALQAGDLLIVRSGDVGTACAVPDTLREANCSDLVIVKQPRAVLPRFGAYYMNSLARKTVRSQQVGVALTHFNTKSAAALPVPVPPISEQERIVDTTDRLLSVVDELGVSIAHDIARCQRLRQVILKWAFEGRLVDQNPTDEQAETLLTRIRTEHGAIAPTKMRRRRKVKGAA